MSSPDDRASAFIDAVLGDLDEARRIVAADPSILYATRIGSPMLHWMVVEDFQLGVVRLIDEFAVDLEHRDEAGSTALHRAAFVGRLGCARILIERGADIESIDPEMNENALHKAVVAEHHDLVLLLLQHGAKRDYQLDAVTTIFDAMAGWSPGARTWLLDALAADGLTPEGFLRDHGRDGLYDDPGEAFGW